MKKHLLLAALCLGLASLGANAQVQSSPSTDQNNPAATPGTPPTFPQDQQQAPTHSHDTDADRPIDQQTPSATNPTGSSVGTPTDSQSTTGASSSATVPQSSTPVPEASGSASQDQSSQSSSSSSVGSQSSDQSTTGAQTGSQSNPSSTSSSSSMGSSAGSDAQSQISSALQQQNLSGVTANVSDKSIELTGTVNTKAEKDQAKSIAQQYANGKKVKDHIKVSNNSSMDKK